MTDEEYLAAEAEFGRDVMCQPGKILELIPRVVAQLGAVPETGQHQRPDYRYRQISDLKTFIGPLMGEAGITVQIRDIAVFEQGHRDTAAGATERYLVVRGVVRFWAPDGSWIDNIIFAEQLELESSDKMWSKLHSNLTKNALENCFLPGTAQGDCEPQRLQQRQDDRRPTSVEVPSASAKTWAQPIEKAADLDALDNVEVNLKSATHGMGMDNLNLRWLSKRLDGKRAFIVMQIIRKATTLAQLDPPVGLNKLRYTENIAAVEKAILRRTKEIREDLERAAGNDQ